MSAEFIQRLEIREGEPTGEPNPFSRPADLPISRFAENLARQGHRPPTFCPPTEVGGYKNEAC